MKTYFQFAAYTVFALVASLWLVHTYTPAAHAQQSGQSLVSGASGNVYGWEIAPQLLSGTSAIDICNLPGGPPCSPVSPMVRICWAKVGNNSGSASTVKLCDKQGTPVCPSGTMAIAANTLYDPVIPVFPASVPCELWPSGATITPGTTNVITFSARGTYAGN